MAESDKVSGGWPDQLYELLRRRGVTQFAYVPDAGHRIVIDRSLADPGVRSISRACRKSNHSGTFAVKRQSTASSSRGSLPTPERARIAFA